MHPDAVLAAHASRQDGVVSREQAPASGLTPGLIRHRLATGHIHLLHRTVYAVGHEAVSGRGQARAALLAIGPGSVASHRWAASLQGMLPAPRGPVHVTRERKARSRPGIVVHKAKLPQEDRAARQGLALTSPARTLLDLAETEDENTIERALGQAEVDRLISFELLESALQRWTGRRGVPVLRDLLDDGSAGLGGTLSWLETHFVPLVRKAALPLPELNVFVHGLQVDALWRRQRVVVELDSRRFHHTATRFERDRARDASLAAHGFVTLRFTYRRVMREAFAVIAELSAALRHRELAAA